MLVLTRRVGEEIVIADQVRIRVAAIRGRRVQLGIDAPASVPVHRQEIHRTRSEFQLATEQTPEVDHLEPLGKLA